MWNRPKPPGRILLRGFAASPYLVSIHKCPFCPIPASICGVTSRETENRGKGAEAVNITIKIGKITLDAELDDTPVANEIAEILPFRTAFNTWGDEIYFTIPVEAQPDDTAREEVEIGDLGYWPTGRAFCIFFGPTPVSAPGKIRPASAVNIVGRVTGDISPLKQVESEQEVIVEMIGPGS
ncbi:MAG: hypothetical protein B5M55_07790 [Desulfococcus sp. 4484_242]|nr:MAG: hypothetical protein B5M55_07790 [Desulfococcus sp. 4484_242]